ncbi:SRPBCC family protein [Streptomyces sp. NPDC052042]|uniref:SRPBCC family protein n=1 Tax=Streptomyces sp. NPDC052042 TaxID=3365683 RepID=UPI0037CD4D66
MSTLEEQIDVDIPIAAAWEALHRAETYPRFVKGVREARSKDGHRTHLDVDVGGRVQEYDAEITDRDKEHTMEWQTTSGPVLAGTFSLLPIDREHTRVQARIEYDPGTVKEAFGGPKGFAQATAIERLVRDDLEHFKELVEQEQ